MAEAERALIEPDQGAENVEAGPGAKLANKADLETARGGSQIGQAEAVGHRRRRICQPIEIIGDRKMLGDVAFPRRHNAAASLDPPRHVPHLMKAPPNAVIPTSIRHSCESLVAIWLQRSRACESRGPWLRRTNFSLVGKVL